MKKLSKEFSIPDKLPPCYERHGESIYFRHDVFSSFQAYYSHKPVPSDALFYATMISEYCALAPAYHLRYHQAFLEIQQITDGNLAFCSDHNCFLAEAGETVLLFPWKDHFFRAGPAGFCSVKSVLIFGNLLDAAIRNSTFYEQPVVRIADQSRFDFCFSELRNVLLERTEENRDERISSLSFDFLNLLNTREKVLRHPEALEKLLTFIGEKNYDLTLSEIAEQAECSIPTLTRLFKENLNDTPHKYLIRKKMERALEMLLSKEKSIKEIAMISGYESPLNFSTEFKKHFGCSPRNYLKKY